MNRDRVSDSELDALLERGRVIQRAPDVVRARALARARAAVAERAVFEPARATAHARGWGMRITVAASLALLMGAAGAFAALRGRMFDGRAATAPARPEAPTAIRPALDQPPPPLSPPASKRLARVEHAARPVTAQESYAAELGLLQRAQVAYAARELPAALLLLAEHARRFPNGRLAEEREALRVRSLASAGRSDEARRATRAFAARFPRSVLLPRLRRSTGNPE